MSPLLDSNASSPWDLVPLPLWEGTSAGICTQANTALCEFVGAPREAILGDRWLSFLEDDQRPAFLRWLSSVSPHHNRFRKHLSIRARGKLRSVWAHVQIQPHPANSE